MEEDKAASGLNQHRNGHRFDLALTALLGLTWAHCACADPKHFDLPAGDARVMLNRFSQQADVQLLFDFNQLRGKTTNTVVGNYEPEDAIRALLLGLPVDFAFVNKRTLALTLKPPARATSRRHWWQRLGSKPTSQSPAPAELEQVLIAGSNPLYQPPPIGAALIQLDRLDIEHSGFATTEDFIHTLPQVFGGGPSQDTLLVGREAPTNSAKGAGVNLRGLNAGATLVLIDGQRTAPSGTQGLFADVSSIPLSAIDHVDILPDGASAQYGADAIGGVVNFVLRSNFVGAETHFREGDFSGNPLGGRQLSQVLGGHWGDSSTAMLGFEWYDRGALLASDRRQATSDLVSLGGSNFNVPYGYPGTILAGSQTWAIARGANANALTSSDLLPGVANLYDQWAGAEVLPDERRWSAFGTVRSEISDGLTLFADSLFTRRQVADVVAGFPLRLLVTHSNPFYFNPTGDGSPIYVLTGSQAYFGSQYAENGIDTGNTSVGATLRVGDSWTLTGRAGYVFEHQHETIYGAFDSSTLDAALVDPEPATAFNPFGDAAANNPTTLAAIARTGAFSSRSNMKILGLAASGPLFPAPGGDATLTLGAEYRQQVFDTTLWSEISVQNPPSPGWGRLQTDLHRQVRAEFAELRVPLIDSGNSRPWLRALELSLGARSEAYSDVGHAAVPKAGFLWSPASSVTIRGTWAKAFRPPALSDLATNNSVSELIPLPDASSASGITNVLVAAGNNPNLQQERARTWTLGAQLTPASLAGLSVALTYFDTSYSDRIDTVEFSPDILNQPQFAWLVSRSFTAAQRGDICNQTVFGGSPATCLDAPIGAIVDNRLRNIESLETRGIDLLGKYSFTTSLGNFSLGLNGTYLLAYSEQKTPGSPMTPLLNTENNPINLRFRGTMSWERASFGASVYLNFDNGYRDVLSVPNRNVHSFTTLDLQMRYRVDRYGPGFLANTELAVTAQNLFNASPPFLNNPLGVGYDQENADLTGRILSVDIRKRW
jgi:iron complex outermembrane recepter protein